MRLVLDTFHSCVLINPQGLLDALRKIVAEGGVLGLWRGCTPAVQRAALVNLGELSAYDQAGCTVSSLSCARLSGRGRC